MSNISRFKVIRTKTVSCSNSQQTITSVGDIERIGTVVGFGMGGSLPIALAVHLQLGQTTADVANMVVKRFHIIAAATNISVAPVVAITSQMRLLERTQIKK